MKRALHGILGLAVSAGALWLTLRGKDLGAIWSAALSADYRYLLPYLGILTAIHVIRTVRWGILLEPVARVSFARLNAVCAVGFMLLVILPLRLGEMARPYLVADRGRGVRVSAALSSVVVERVADGLFTAALLVLTLRAVPPGPRELELVRASGILVFVAFALLLVFLIVAYRNRELALRITHRLIDPISPRIAVRVSEMVDAFIQGLRLVPSRAKVLAFFLLTFVYWALNAWGIAIFARAFGFHLSAMQAATVLGVLIVGIMIPSGPGMVGTFQMAIVLGLSLFVPRASVDTQGAAFANVLWLVQLGQQVTFGLVFMFSRHIRLGALTAPQPSPIPAPEVR